MDCVRQVLGTEPRGVESPVSRDVHLFVLQLVEKFLLLLQPDLFMQMNIALERHGAYYNSPICLCTHSVVL